MTTPAKVRHGTKQGYDKHWRTRKGRWGWPACERCTQALTASGRQYRQQPDKVAASRLRHTARQRAFRRLQRMHPGDYARVFTEELSILRDGGTVVVENLQAELDRSFPAQRMQKVAEAVRQRAATPAESRLYAEYLSLRKRLDEARQRVAEHRDSEAGDEEAREPACAG